MTNHQFNALFLLGLAIFGVVTESPDWFIATALGLVILSAILNIPHMWRSQ